MNRHKIILQILLLGFTCSLFSQSISKDDAVNIAIEFLQKQDADNGIMTINSTDTAKTLIVEDENRAYMYVVEAIDGDWVIVSADERIAPILGYGKEGFPAVKDMPPAMIDLINGYSYEMQYIFDSLNITTIHPERLGDTENDDTTDEESDGSFVYTPGECLLNRPNRGEVNWDQSANNDYTEANNYTYDRDKIYNKFCPVINGIRTPVGCTAVAMGQIMWYWQWPHTSIVPESIDAQNNYSTEEILQLYDWSLISNEITDETPLRQADMIASILRDCGYAAKMKYTPNGSSATIPNAKTALISTFSYTVASYNWRFLTPNWSKKIRENINKGLPVIYAGYKIDGSGHTFIVDGYNKTDNKFFHINWGWGGLYNDNYFYLNDLRPDLEDKKYKFGHEALFGIKPNPNCENKYINETVNENSIYRIGTAGIITTSNKIEKNAIAIFYSNKEIVFSSGFEIELGAELYADIQHFPCDLVAPLSIEKEYAPSNNLNNKEKTNKQQSNLNIVHNHHYKTLEIKNNIEQIKKIDIYSISGNKILTTINPNINIALLNKGIYLIKITYNNGNFEISKIGI